MPRHKEETVVVLVNNDDEVVGSKEKFAAHRHPVALHRAISVVIYDPTRSKMLLQKRAANKPTWPLHWSNTCCTHPYPGESYEACANRRLKEEMGIQTPLKRLFSFTYEAKYDENWGEHEYDVVFEGENASEIKPDPEEVVDHKWMTIEELKADIGFHPETYTPWLKLILARLEYPFVARWFSGSYLKARGRLLFCSGGRHGS